MMSPLIQALYETAKEINSPVSHAFQNFLMTQDPKDLKSIEVDPLAYNSADLFQYDYRLSKLLSKNEFFPAVETRTRDTLVKMLEAEAHLRLYHRTVKRTEDPDFWDFRARVSLRMCKAVKDFEFRNVIKYATFGPGRTATRSSSNAIPVMKFTGPFSISQSLLGRLIQLIENGDFQYEDDPFLYAIIKRGDYLIKSSVLYDMVPKTFKVLRGVSYEPDLDVYIQLAINGWMVAEVLPKFGIYIRPQEVNGSIRHQPLLHRQTVVAASREGLYATGDLSSASDLISRPDFEEHFEGTAFGHFVLGACTPATSFEKFGGGTYNMLRLGGMGNAIIFPLETLWFFSIIEEATREVVTNPSLVKSVCYNQSYMCSTYGDDLLYPSIAHENVQRRLTETYPFIFNKEKSYAQGKFRESCGTDAYNGFDITPLKIKRDPSKILARPSFQKKFEVLNRTAHQKDARALQKALTNLKLNRAEMEAIRDHITICNGIYKMATWCHHYDDIWMQCYRRCYNMLPRALQYLSGPESFGSAVLHNGRRRYYERFGVRQFIGIIEQTSKGIAEVVSDKNMLTIRQVRGCTKLEVPSDALLNYALSGGNSDFTSRVNRTYFAFKLM